LGGGHYRRGGIAIPLIRQNNAASLHPPRRRSAASSRFRDFHALVELRFVAMDDPGAGGRPWDQGGAT